MERYLWSVSIVPHSNRLSHAITGDMIYFHSFKNPGLIVDIVQDIRGLNELSRQSRKAGMIILGGGVCKHQIANAMLIVGGFPRSLSLVMADLSAAEWG